MAWAIIKTGGKQYKVKEGDTIFVEKLDGLKDNLVTFDEVLLVSNDKLSIGTPQLERAQVKAKILENVRGDKVRVVKFKSKSRYLKTRGHRQTHTKVLIEKISH